MAVVPVLNSFDWTQAHGMSQRKWVAAAQAAQVLSSALDGRWSFFMSGWFFVMGISEKRQ